MDKNAIPNGFNYFLNDLVQNTFKKILLFWPNLKFLLHIQLMLNMHIIFTFLFYSKLLSQTSHEFLEFSQCCIIGSIQFHKLFSFGYSLSDERKQMIADLPLHYKLEFLLVIHLKCFQYFKTIRLFMGGIIALF
jgi:hypothetical protein